MSSTTELRRVPFTRRFQHALQQEGASPFTVLSSLAKWPSGPQQLRAAETLLYRTWEASRKETSQTFLGKNGHDRINAQWMGGWEALTQDRIWLECVLRGFGLPVAETIAVMGSRALPDTPCLATKDDVLTLLRNAANYPLIVKSAQRRPGQVHQRIERYDSTTDELVRDGQGVVGAETFVAQLFDDNAEGFLFQRELSPHPETSQLCHGKLGVLRFHCLSDDEGIEISRVTFQIPRSGNWSSSLLNEGILLAGVDTESGTILHAIELGEVAYDELDTHPDNDAPLTGVTLPDWDQVIRIVRQAAHALTDCHIQGWDVALTMNGPVILNLQAGGGDPTVSQLGYQAGLLEGRYADFAARCLDRRKQRRSASWSELKGNMSQQFANLQLDEAETSSSPEEPSAEATSADGENTATLPTSANEDFELDTEAKTDFSFSQRMLHAVSQHQANLMTIVSDVAKLSRSPYRLPPYEYFLYQLWDEKRFTPEAKQTFVGSDGWVRINKAMENKWREFAEDKLALAAMLRAHRLPIPTTQAIYHAGRHFPGARSLTSQDAVANFLRKQASYPLFGKPVGGQQSCGAVAIERYDESSDELVLTHGPRVSIDAFIEQITAADSDAGAYGSVQLKAGYLFQSQLTPHADIDRVVGQRTGTVRMVCVADEDGVELVRASWKIPAGANVADNLWRGGNMLGGIDLETGKLTHVVQPGPLECQLIDQHPDSNVSFADFQFPLWEEMCATVKRAAELVPDCTFQGWDVALCKEGPVLVELQAGGGNPVLAQLGYDQGLLHGRYAKHALKALGR